MPRSLAEVHQYFGGTHHHDHQCRLIPWHWGQGFPPKCRYSTARLHGVTSQKTVTFTDTALRLLNRAALVPVEYGVLFCDFKIYLEMCHPQQRTSSEPLMKKIDWRGWIRWLVRYKKYGTIQMQRWFSIGRLCWQCLSVALVNACNEGSTTAPCFLSGAPCELAKECSVCTTPLCPCLVTETLGSYGNYLGTFIEPALSVVYSCSGTVMSTYASLNDGDTLWEMRR